MSLSAMGELLLLKSCLNMKIKQMVQRFLASKDSLSNTKILCHVLVKCNNSSPKYHAFNKYLAIF